MNPVWTLAMTVLVSSAFSSVYADPPDVKLSPPTPVQVVNAASAPVPVTLQGTSSVTGIVDVSGSVSITGTPTVNIAGGSVHVGTTKVADINALASIPASINLAPTTSVHTPSYGSRLP